MNASAIDPMQADFPEVIEEYLEHGEMKCVAFNRRGTLLAAGCSDGSCLIWDFGTRSIAKILRDKDCTAAITSVCWSKYGHRILVSAVDKSLTLWDVMRGNKIARSMLEKTPMQALLHPGSTTSSICLVSSLSSAPLIVDMDTTSTIVLPIALSNEGNSVCRRSRKNFSNGNVSVTPTAACFNKYGDLVYVGNSKGEILIIDQKSIRVRGIFSVPGGAMVKNIGFSRNGLYLLTNSSDRIIRIFENLLPLKDALQALNDANHEEAEKDEAEKLKAGGSRCLALLQEFQDPITKVHWKAACVSCDGEWVVGAPASNREHKIYIWARAGHLVKVLEGPKEKLIDLVWHPVHPVMLSVSFTGLVYIWAKDRTENWSAFAPDFQELEANEEYVEREDEFDLMPESEKVKDSDAIEDEEIDILTVDKDPVFSDSDMSQEEICYLPADPCPDVPEQQDVQHVVSNPLLEDGNKSESPLSKEAGHNFHLTSHASSPLEEVGRGTLLRKKRKPSQKEVALQQKTRCRMELLIDVGPDAALISLVSFSS